MRQPSNIGITVRCWDTLRRDAWAFTYFTDCCRVFGDEGIIVLSQETTAASPVVLREYLPKSIVMDKRMMSLSRLFRLVERVYHFTDNGMQILSDFTMPKAAAAARFGLVVSNGFGLGHVVRMTTIACSLAPYGNIGIMSFSAGLCKSDSWPVFYLASAEYLKLHKEEGLVYTREATQHFIDQFSPTHILYDGNVLPPGMLAALARYPDIHLTWIRRGMWQPDTDARYMAQQALADLVLEPGDLADDYDTGPTWHRRNAFVQPRMFLKTLPLRPETPQMNKVSARIALGLPLKESYALLMLGASQDVSMEPLLTQAVQQVRDSGVHPVIAHWPIDHRKAPQVKGATVIERMPIVPYYNAFDFVISAAGYNSYHELLASGLPVIFMPQEDAGRDQQLTRARYAADKGWARLCRQQDISVLHEHITALVSTHVPLPAISWLKDWQPIVQALCGKIIPLHPQTEHVMPTVFDCDITAFFHALFIRYAARYHPFNTRFILLADESELELLATLLIEPDVQNVIITNTVNPLVLRRMGLHYLWLNCPWLPTRRAMIKQFCSWLKLWRPRELTYLAAGHIRHILPDSL